MKLGRLLARLFIGGLFIGHGTQKWFGWFGGPGIEGTTGMMEKLGLAPAGANARAAAASETLGGVGIALGAFTPAAAAALIGTMVTAIRTVHLKNGFWSSGGGYEFNLTLIAALLLIVDGGPGPISVDGRLRDRGDRRRRRAGRPRGGRARLDPHPRRRQSRRAEGGRGGSRRTHPRRAVLLAP